MIRLLDILSEKFTVSETIKASDAYNDSDSVQTVIDGKREMAYLVITEQKMIDPRGSISALRNAINNGMTLRPLKGRNEGIAFLICRKLSGNVEKFAKFIESKGGYLEDKTPEDARFIGDMLGYNPDDIEEYIKNRYKKQPADK